ncbi:unnamed protein product [Paramecium primaurelia]|uniref:Uncharacterized protein n=1 Tax=Paramecium primaurelia TaxID=5886 RepID=A0A8S1KJ13_PARPR|nr:unnamed protein product [Paramecium primaurelia]
MIQQITLNLIKHITQTNRQYGIRYIHYQMGSIIPNKSISQHGSTLECRTLRITQMKEKQADFRNPFEVEILETTQIFNTQDTFSIILDKSHELINRKIYAKSFTNKSIQSYLNKCNECLQSQQYQFKHNCYGAINTINFSIKLFPTTQAHQELILSIIHL